MQVRGARLLWGDAGTSPLLALQPLARVGLVLHHICVESPSDCTGGLIPGESAALLLSLTVLGYAGTASSTGEEEEEKDAEEWPQQQGLPQARCSSRFLKRPQPLFQGTSTRARVAQSRSQHSPHTGAAHCDCSHTLVSSFAQLYSHEGNIPSRTSCKACSALVTHLSSQWESHCSCQALPAQRQIITRQGPAGKMLLWREGGWRRTPHSWLVTALHSSPSLHCTVKVCRPLCHCALLVSPSQYQELLCASVLLSHTPAVHPAGPGVSVISVPCCGKSCRALCWLVEQVLGVPFPAHPPSSSMLHVSRPCCNLLQWTPKTPLLSCS
nr:uncharacterized protein LOC106629324 [Zonotrichia albicollis]